MASTASLEMALSPRNLSSALGVASAGDMESGGDQGICVNEHYIYVHTFHGTIFCPHQPTLRRGEAVNAPKDLFDHIFAFHQRIVDRSHHLRIQVPTCQAAISSEALRWFKMLMETGQTYAFAVQSGGAHCQVRRNVANTAFLHRCANNRQVAQ